MKQQWKETRTMVRTLRNWALMGAFLTGMGVQAAEEARAYAHGFQNGNLIPNWSFEAVGQTWDSSTHTDGIAINPRFKMSDLGGSSKAVSGSFAGSVTGTATGVVSGGNLNFTTPYLPIRSFVGTYMISFYYRGSPIGTVRPVIRLYTERNNPSSQISQIEGDAYSASPNDWTLYTCYVYTTPATRYFKVALAETQVAGHGGTLYFDDVVLEERLFTPRSQIIEAVKFVDGLGRTHQTQSYYSGSKVNPFPGWGKSGRIRVNTSASGAGITENLRNFPLLVRLTGANFNFSEAKSNGEDIRFSDAAGNPLGYEIDFWNGGAQSAAVWVNLPNLVGNKVDNDFFMHWGNGSSVSQSNGPAAFNSIGNFLMAYHADGAPGNPMAVSGINSVSGNADANSIGPEWQALVPGQIGKGMDGSPDAIHYEGLYLWDQREMISELTSAYTFSVWMKLRAFGTNPYIDIVSVDGNFCGDYRDFYIYNGKLILRDRVGNAFVRWETPNPVPADNATFHHLAVSFDPAASGEPNIFFDGAKLTLTRISEGPSTINFTTLKARFGADCDFRGGLFGVLDEMRIDGINRSADWIKMSYQNQKSGSNVLALDRTVQADRPTQLLQGGVTYDAWGRSQRDYLPCQSRTGDLADPATCTADPDLPNMGGVPFSQVQYAAEIGARAVEASMPGAANAMGSGHTSKSDYYYVNTLNLPASQTAIEAFPTAPNDTTYHFRWSKDPDGNYTLSWTNRKGQLIQVAKNATRPANFSQWEWAKTRYEYFLNGSLKRTYSPLDMVPVTPTTKFSLVTSMNTLGQTSAQYSPDHGLVTHWYNRRGQIRFNQDSGQRVASGTYDYFDYDARGRLLTKGTFNIGTMTQAIADQDVASGGTAKSEKIGYIYDDLSTFLARTGLSLTSVMPATYAYRQDFITAAHGYGRLICKYNRNGDNPATLFSALDKFVAEFMLYNREGRVERIFKYFGPLRQNNARFQEVVYDYDASGRIESESIYDNAIDGTTVTNHFYAYDDQGRLSKVTGDYSLNPIAEFGYTSWGPLKYVIVGGNGTGGAGTRFDYAYHTLGGVREIKATRLRDGKVLFQQFLGYDGKADPSAAAPANPAPRYTGTITQQLYKLGTETNLSTPIRLVDYTLDELGRMLEAKYQHNSSGSVTNPDGSIKYGFAWNDAPDNDSYFTYDLNGRIISQRSGGAVTAGNYNYLPDSYKLDFVNPPVLPASSRTMTTGNFEYNARGAMTYDRSKDVSMEYGWDLMPTRFVKNARALSVKYEQYHFYDADGKRVSKAEAYFDGSVRNWVNAKHYVSLKGRVAKEVSQPLGSDGSSGLIDQTPYLFGKTQVGRLQHGNAEFYLMNHQGSLMMTVDRNGDVPTEGEVINDYMAYGNPRKLVTSAATAPTRGYTGKEFDDIFNLTYFGARHYDAELAYWNSPDPGKQFWSPYAYGPDGINGSDPDGWDWLKFTGSMIWWYGGEYGDESHFIDSYEGYSGGDGGSDPLPNGRYQMNLAPEITEAKTVSKTNLDLASKAGGGIETIPAPGHEGWGTYRVRLFKVKVDDIRDNFYIHDPVDGLEDTHGCIGLRSCDFFKDLIKYKESGHKTMDVMVDAVHITDNCVDDGTGLAKTSGGEPCIKPKVDPPKPKLGPEPAKPVPYGGGDDDDDAAEVCQAGLEISGGVAAAFGAAMGPPGAVVFGGATVLTLGTAMCWDYISDAGDFIYRKSGEAKDATIREVRQTGRDIYEGAGAAKDAVVDFFSF